MPRQVEWLIGRLLKWAQVGVRKYPDNPTLLGYLNKAYTLTGQTDSVVAVTNRIMAKDTTDVVPALSAAKALIDAKRPKEAVPFLDFAIKHGDPQAKENAAALLYTGAAPLLQQPQDLQGAAELLRMAVGAANPAGQGRSGGELPARSGDAVPGAADRSPGREAKSCDLAKQEETLLGEAETALTAGRAVNPEAVDKNLGIIKQYKPRVASMLKAYCKRHRGYPWAAPGCLYSPRRSKGL